jgi:hypothetical protein
MRWVRYLLRLLLAVMVLLDVKLAIRFVAPPDDHFFKLTTAGWLLTGLTFFLFLSVQIFLVWLDVRIGQRRRRQPLVLRGIRL